MNTSAFIGEHDGENYYLQSPKWDCNWYVGFGYLQSNSTSTHLDWFLDETTPKKDMKEQLEKSFSRLAKVLKDDKTIWKFCELFQSWTTLKESYEFYNRGGSHYSDSGLDQKDFKMASRILKDLLDVVNEICKILKIEGLDYSARIERDVYNNMHPSTFTKNTPSNKKEWTLAYLNKYDKPQNHKDKVIPKIVLENWKKELEAVQE